MAFLATLRTEVKRLADLFGTSLPVAFGMWFAQTELEIDDDEAYEALVDGPNDKGMDVFWVDDANQRVFIAQCKYSPKGLARPQGKDLDSLLGCADWLASPESAQREGRPELVAAAAEYRRGVQQGYAVRFCFAYCGRRSESVEKRIRAFNANPDNSRRRWVGVHYDLTLMERLYEESQGRGQRIPSASIALASGIVEVSGTFGRGLVTSITGAELVSLYQEFGDELFARNVRGWLGARKGSVNAGIIDTVESDRDRGNFWAYNNGITIVCDDYQYDKRSHRLQLDNFSIVNGCQTTVALKVSEAAGNPGEVFLLARVICPPKTIIDSVIRFTNSQNQIRRWDLVSQERVQRRLKKEFEGLTQPFYYAIRRGDWGALSPSDRRRFGARGAGAQRIVKHDLLGQYLASFKGRAVVAYKNKAFLFDKYYEETFPADIRVEEALFVWRAGECTQRLVREDIREEGRRVQRGEKDREKYVLMLKRGGRFYALAALGRIAQLRNGPDYLRSITEERITSKAATARIERYARSAIGLYKQAVSDMLQVSGTDLSVMIREQDFSDRLRERVTNLFETMSVSDKWLADAVPELH